METRCAARSVLILILNGCFLSATICFAEQNEKPKANPATERRAWTSADGTFTTYAEVVAFIGDDVRLKKDDGKIITIQIDRLSAADRSLLRGLRQGEYRNIFVGDVAEVMDGDTLDVVDAAGERFTIRLQGIDAPEDTQPGGKESCELLRKLVASEKVYIAWVDYDKYERVLGQVFVGDTWVNLAMLNEGGAWHYVEYSSDKQLAKAEREARNNRVGLWATENPIPPWEYRMSQAESSVAESTATGRIPLGLLSSGNENASDDKSTSNAASSTKARRDTAKQAVGAEIDRREIRKKSDKPATPNRSVTVYITKTGEKYHSAGCRHLKKSAIPIDLESAKRRYTPCSVCNPSN